MNPSAVNFVLALGGYVISGLMIALWWFWRRDTVRHEECLRHLDADVNKTRIELENWKQASTGEHIRLTERQSAMQGEINGLSTLVASEQTNFQRTIEGQIRSEELIRSLDKRLARIEDALHFLAAPEPGAAAEAPTRISQRPRRRAIVR
jgi:hypothetical protein